jgi:hypothetical protein
MREPVYLSTKKLGTFLPDWPSLSVRGMASAGMGTVCVTVDVSAASPAGFDEATVKVFRRVRGHLEREAGHFTSPELEAGPWIFFDVKMGYGTLYRATAAVPPGGRRRPVLRQVRLRETALPARAPPHASGAGPDPRRPGADLAAAASIGGSRQGLRSRRGTGTGQES